MNNYGTTLSVTVNSVAVGQQFYVAVDGADNTAFGTGSYALSLNLGAGASPTATSPNTQTANGAALQSGGGRGEGDVVQHSGGLIAGVGRGLFGGLSNVVSGAGGLLAGVIGLLPGIGLGGAVGDTYGTDENGHACGCAFCRGETRATSAAFDTAAVGSTNVFLAGQRSWFSNEQSFAQSAFAKGERADEYFARSGGPDRSVLRKVTQRLEQKLADA